MNANASFLYFLASTTLSTIALHCIRFGVSWLVMRETGSVTAFAFIFSASSLAEVYSKPVLSPMADYFDRLKVYRVCVGLATVIVVALLLAVVLLPFSIPLLAGLLMALSLIAGLRDPASAGLVPALVRADWLTEAQSLRSTAASVVGLGGPALSALLLAVGGVPAALGAATLAGVAALVTSFRMSVLRADVLAVPKQPGDYLKTWHLRVADGVRAVVMTRSERTMALGIALTNAGLYPFFFVVLPLWVARDLRASASTMAIIEIAFGIGIFAGSTLLADRMNAAIGRFIALVVGNGLLGAGLLGAAFFTHPIALALCFAVGGAGFAVFNINASTLRAAATPPAFRSRMAAGVAFLSSCLNPFAAQGMGVMVERLSATSGVALSGALILVSTALLLRNVDAKSLLVRSNDEIIGAYGTLYPRAFAERQHPANA